MKQKFYFSFKMSEKYKYSSKGKTYTYDLSPLTDEEKKKFHKMSHTNRLRFIEQHKLEEVPLLDTYTVRTAAESTDKKRRWKKEMDLYNSQFIKNGLEEMKNKGKTLDEDTLKKQFTDEQYNDIEKRIKEGYNDFDKLINYYVNQINTLNVESIDTMNAKNLNELKADQINKLVFDTKQLDKLLKDPINQLIRLQDLDKIKDNVKALEAIDSGNITSLINELKNMNLDGIVDNINNKINTALEQLNEITKIDIKASELLKVLGNENDREELQAMVEELKQQKKTVNDLIDKYNKSEIDKQQLEQLLKDVGLTSKEIKDTLKNIENKTDYVIDLQTQTKVNLDDYKSQIDKLDEAINIINEYKQGEIDKKELKQQLDENKALKENDITYINANTDQLNFLTNQIVGAMTVLKQKEELIERLRNNNLNFNGALKLITDNITTLFNEIKREGLPFNDGTNIKDLASFGTYNPVKNILVNNASIALNSGSSSSKQGILKGIKVIAEEGNKFLKQNFPNEYEMWIKPNQIQQGQGVEGGSFKNRFKDFTPDINKLNDKIERLQNEVNELKKQKEEKTERPSFLSQIREGPTLKPVIKQEMNSEVENEEQYKPILDILKKRREDIEYSDTDEDVQDEDNEWGEGIKNKYSGEHRVYKFSELFY